MGHAMGWRPPTEAAVFPLGLTAEMVHLVAQRLLREGAACLACHIASAWCGSARLDSLKGLLGSPGNFSDANMLLMACWHALQSTG